TSRSFPLDLTCVAIPRTRPSPRIQLTSAKINFGPQPTRPPPPALCVHSLPCSMPLREGILMHDVFPRRASDSSASSVNTASSPLSRLSEPASLRKNAVCASSSRLKWHKKENPPRHGQPHPDREHPRDSPYDRCSVNFRRISLMNRANRHPVSKLEM